MIYVIALATVIVVALALRCLAIMFLWNWIVPAITTLGEISYLEAIGVYLLVSLLFGSLVPSNPTTPKVQQKT